MPTKQVRKNSQYGFPVPIEGMPQEPIITNRAPTTADQAELGTIWIDEVGQSFYILVAIQSGSFIWATTSGGATTLTSLTVNPGNVIVTAGNLTMTTGDITANSGTGSFGTLSAGNTTIAGTVGITGNTTVTGDLDVTGAVTLTGDVDITDTASISLTSTNNAAGAITLLANGGTNETILVQSAQGTGDGAIFINSVAGGVDITGAKASANAINMHATDAAGGMT